MRRFYEKIPTHSVDELRQMTKEELLAEANQAVRAYDQATAWRSGASNGAIFTQTKNENDLSRLMDAAADVAEHAEIYYQVVQRVYEEVTAFPVLHDSYIPDPDEPRVTAETMRTNNHKYDEEAT